MGSRILRNYFSVWSIPIKVRILLGDNDFTVIDGCDQWADKGWKERLENEIDLLIPKFQSTVKSLEVYGAEVVIQKWSSLYEPCVAMREVPKAEVLISEVNTPSLIKDSKDIYLAQWGYNKLSQKMGLPKDDIIKFIVQDLQRTAAQYSVESSIVRSFDGVQLWCEKVPKPSWPIELSNYDNAGYVGSLMMVG